MSSWKGTVNAALTRATGYRLERAPSGPPIPRRGARGPRRRRDRLLVAPAFILSSVRSGSTLLRVILDSHSQLHAPPELHLRDLEAVSRSKYADRALEEIRLDGPRLQYLLWDRVLHRELAASGKRRLVNKTPNDVFIADRLRECWPDARFVYLLRHPVATARSRHATRPQDSEERNLEMVLRYATALEDARARYDGLTVRYEDLAAEPERITREVCDFLGVAWEPSMLAYGEHDHGRLRPGLGDWKDKIRSGRIQAPEPLPAPEEIPEALRDLCVAWGYVDAARAT